MFSSCIVHERANLPLAIRTIEKEDEQRGQCRITALTLCRAGQFSRMPGWLLRILLFSRFFYSMPRWLLRIFIRLHCPGGWSISCRYICLARVAETNLSVVKPFCPGGRCVSCCHRHSNSNRNRTRTNNNRGGPF